MSVFGLPGAPNSDIKVFTGNSITDGSGWVTWIKPQGKTMCSIFVLGAGGNGGTGVVGANSTAGAGGGGGSGGQTHVLIPLCLLPDKLFVSAGLSGAIGSNGAGSYVSIASDTTTQSANIVVYANGGTRGSNASGGTGGNGGNGASQAGASGMAFGWAFVTQALAGQNGIAGGAAIAGAALTLPITGLRVTGGTGGGGLPAAAATGTNGGSFTVPSDPTIFPAQKGGTGSATATNPADNGSNGFQISSAGLYFYGGTGGASTHGTATGGGLVQSNGGNGSYGCGGGGAGGALTGSAAGVAGRGGNGLVIISCY